MCSWLGLLSWSGAAIDVTLAPKWCKSKIIVLQEQIHQQLHLLQSGAALNLYRRINLLIIRPVHNQNLS